jgi:hypothetical protein
VGEIFRTRTDRTWGPPTSHYNEYRVYFAVGKRPGSGGVHPPPSSDEVKERVLLRLYSPLGLYGMLQGELVGRVSGYSDWLRAGRSGDRILVRARFSAPFQTDPGAHPASCTMGTVSFPGVESGRGVTLTPHPFYRVNCNLNSTYLKSKFGIKIKLHKIAKI